MDSINNMNFVDGMSQGHRTIPNHDGIMCARLSPPPAPPWLMDSPTKLHHLLANCSAWQRYNELCGNEVKTNYPLLWTIGKSSSIQELPRQGIQWVPTGVVLSLAFIIFMLIICLYLYRRYRRAPWKSIKYQKQLSLTPSTSRDYCSPGLTPLTPSVTVETQLSLWALEDHIPLRHSSGSNLSNNSGSTRTHSPFHGENGSPFTLDTSPNMAIITTSSSSTSPSPIDPYWKANRTGPSSASYPSSQYSEEVLLQPQNLLGVNSSVIELKPCYSGSNYSYYDNYYMDSAATTTGDDGSSHYYDSIEPSTATISISNKTTHGNRNKKSETPRCTQLPSKNQNRQKLYTKNSSTLIESEKIYSENIGNDCDDYELEMGSQRGSQTILVTKEGMNGVEVNQPKYSSHSKGIVKACRQAGAKLANKIQRERSLRQSRGKHQQHDNDNTSMTSDQKSTSQKIGDSIAKLGQSLTHKKSKFRQKLLKNRKSESNPDDSESGSISNSNARKLSVGRVQHRRKRDEEYDFIGNSENERTCNMNKEREVDMCALESELHTCNTDTDTMVNLNSNSSARSSFVEDDTPYHDNPSSNQTSHRSQSSKSAKNAKWMPNINISKKPGLLTKFKLLNKS